MEGQSRGFVFSGQVMEVRNQQSLSPRVLPEPRARPASSSGLYAAVVENHSSPAQVRRSWMESNC